MLPSPRTAFLSTSKARDPRLHRDINTWHQLDHRPENLALEGVAYGERFVHPPELARRSQASGDFADFDYANLYWFDEPVDAAIATWADFAEQTLLEGRRPDVDLVERGFMDFFRVAGMATSPDLRLNERAFYYRPGTGVLVRVTALPGDLSRSERQARNAWELEELLPQVVAVPGVAAAWVLERDSSLAPAAWREREAAGGAGRPEGIRLLWAVTEVGPPAEVLDRLDAGAAPAWSTPPAGDRAELRFSGALETITPWQWSWFDGEVS